VILALLAALMGPFNTLEGVRRTGSVGWA